MTSGFGPYRISGTQLNVIIPYWAIPKLYSRTSPPPSDWEIVPYYETIDNTVWISGLNNVRNDYFMFYAPTVQIISTLRARIDMTLRVKATYTYPPYLLDPNSFTSAVTTVWTNFTSWVTQTHLNQKYDELYFAGIDYDSVSIGALIKARTFLDRGDTSNAQKYIQKSETYEKLSNMSFQAANEVFMGSLDAAETLAQGIKDASQTSVTFGLSIVNPTAAKVVSFTYDVIDFGLEYWLGAKDQAIKDFVVKQAVNVIFNEVQFQKLGGRTISDWVQNRSGKELFPILSELIASEECQWALSKIIKEGIAEIAESAVTGAVDYIVDSARSMVNYQEVQLKSPGELRVHDSQGRVTGLVNNEVRAEIPKSVYNNGVVTIFFPTDVYTYEVVGTGEGAYGLEITFVEKGETNTVVLREVPTSATAVHQHTITGDKGKETCDLKITAIENEMANTLILTNIPTSPSVARSYIVDWTPLTAKNEKAVTIDVNIGVNGTSAETIVIKPPIASFAWSSEKPVAGDKITFDASGSYDADGQIVSYEWDFGDGTTSSGREVTHIYLDAGDYTITLTVKDDDGAGSIYSSAIQVRKQGLPIWVWIGFVSLATLVVAIIVWQRMARKQAPNV